jgi:uncharacterized protein YjdB
MRILFPLIFLLFIGLTTCKSEEKSVSSIIVVSPSDSIITKEGTMQMVAQIEPEDAALKTAIWSVTNTQGKATIGADGLLTAAADGLVTIIATATDGTGVKGLKDILIKNQITLVSSILVLSSSDSVQ